MFKKKYTEEEVDAIVNNALQNQREQIAQEQLLNEMQATIDDLKNRVAELEKGTHKTGF